VFSANPLYTLVSGYRAVLLGGSPPAWGPLAALATLSWAVFLAGHAWFYRLRRSFADLL